MAFDPYYQWLGIPPDQQPPDHYQLLGLTRFEANPSVISTAADRQLILLKTIQDDEHRSLARQLIDEIAAARICLLKSESKSEYDTRLRRGELDASRNTAAAAESFGVADDVGIVTEEQFGDAAIGTAETGITPLPLLKLSYVLPVALVILLTAVVTLWGLWGFHAPPMSNELPDRWIADSPVQDATGDLAATSSHQGGLTVPAVPTESSDVFGPGVLTKPNEDWSEPGSQAASSTVMNTPVEPTEKRDLDPADDPEAAEPSEPISGRRIVAGGVMGVFARLPQQINLHAAASMSATDRLFLGELGAPAVVTWNVSVEDFSVPRGTYSNQAAPAKQDGETIRWSLTRSVVGEPVSRDATVPQESMVIAADIEARGQDLFLVLKAPGAVHTIDRLSLCSLTLQTDHDSHCIQLHPVTRIPPVLVQFSRSREVAQLESIPLLGKFAVERLRMQVLSVRHSSKTLSDGPLPPVAFNEETVVDLQGEYPCQLGIRVVEKDGLLSLSLVPRIVLDDRKQVMTKTTMSKEMAKRRSQLTRNIRDLQQAQSELPALTAEIARMNANRPRTPMHAASWQARMSQLNSKAQSAQSRVRRLSQVIPELSRSLEEITELLSYVDQLSGNVQLHFRILLAGQGSDFILLSTDDLEICMRKTNSQVISDLCPPLGRRDRLTIEKDLHLVPLLRCAACQQLHNTLEVGSKVSRIFR